MRFVDSSFWIALQIPRDRHHAEATALWGQGSSEVLTSNLVLGETWTTLRKRLGHRVASRFMNTAHGSPRISITFVDEEIDARAWEWLQRRDERVYSYVDATSFEIMRRERITEALAFDQDFTAAGFIEVRPGA